jgi:NADH-quinone oxidoreductase subunit A
MNLDQYLPVLLFMVVGIFTGLAPQIMGYILGPNKPYEAKNSRMSAGLKHLVMHA